MADEVLNKLKQTIDFSSVSRFDTEDFIQHGYIPLVEKDSMLYVGILRNASQNEIKDRINAQVGPKEPKFVMIEDKAFDSLLNYVKENIDSGTSDQTQIVENQIEESYDVGDDTSMDDSNDMSLIGDSLNLLEPQISLDDEMETNNNSNIELSSNKPHKRIGEILIDMGLLTEEQLFNALVEAKNESLPIGTALVQKGYVTVGDLKKALGTQQGHETINDEQLKIDSTVLKLLPEDFIKLNSVMPINSDGKTLVLGMVNPNDRKVINDVISFTGLRVRAMLITHYEFSMCLDTYYNESKKETNKIIQEIEQESVQLDDSESLWEQAERELKENSSTVVKFVNQLISNAIDQKASDIHIEPRLTNYVVRFRTDGILREVLELPSKTESAIITRLKVISKMNIAEHRRPQDGSFSITYKGKEYDFRINTLPISNKEKMVIRILTPAVALKAKNEDIVLEGATQEDIERLNKIKSAPNGIILATGPTGSGKTTTLYSVLRNLNDEKINITTIEDPIEIRIEGINQSQINTKAGITFASCLRAILRQDPDVILVGEIRDFETLEVAISAALTGHLVLTTLHTNSAAATITRLIEMGAKDYLISSTIAGVIAQRLVRRLCKHCREKYNATEQEARLIIASEDEVQKFCKIPIYRAKGCDKCGLEGYSGRMGVYEIMQITKEIKKLIAQGAHDIQIEEAAIGAGMKTLQQSCLGHLIKGETTISEFIRVLGPVNE